MANYVDGFALPIPRKYISEYQLVAQRVANIWKEHGALAYFEFIGDDLSLEGTRAFADGLNANPDEDIIFGWVVFESKEARNLANEQVASDKRMTDLISPLTDPSRRIFDASRMLYGGFQSFV